jgi:hypothetical protein
VIDKSGKSAERAAEEGRRIQAHVDSQDRARPPAKKSANPMQAGQRDYPEQFSPQHLQKPGSEKDLAEAPMFEAPGYKGSDKLRGMAAIISGGDSGIGRAVAVLYAREGADIGIVYLNEHEDAKETKRLVEKEGRRCFLIPGDVSNAEFCKDAVASCDDRFLCEADTVAVRSATPAHVRWPGSSGGI